MASRTLDALRAATGADAGPELAVAVGGMPFDRLDELAETIVAESVHSTLTAPARTQVWPVVTIRASTFASGGVYRDAAGPAGLNLNAALNPRFAGTGHFSGGVLRALLYCHGLVIEDPVTAAAEMYLGTRRELRAVARLAVVAATTSIVEIAPLLDADVISTYFTTSDQQEPVRELGMAIARGLAQPGAAYSVADAWAAFEASYIEGLTPPLQELWRRVRSGDRSPPLELVEQGLQHGDVDVVSTFIDVLANLRPQSVIDNAADMVAAAVLAVEGLGGFYDLLCPSSLFAKMLFLGTPDPAHEVRLHELGRVPVPGIGDLRVTDAVRIRQTSDVFALWREQLTDALAQAHQIRQTYGTDADTSAVVREVIADARTSLHREARRSRLLNTANPLVFVAGALGGAVSGIPGGAVGAAVGAVGGALAPLVQAVLNTRRVPGFVDRHYLVFEPKRAAD
jgi:hypothetical protein